ncbi:MAG: HAD hydrolase-like protein [Eubacteriales bacterium]|nr:HAD hydrolase-like protein [Eubacteriales bacterium]
MNKLIIFDLDGTLTDSAPGITNCARLALQKMGYPEYTQEELNTFVGPPLQVHFVEFAHMNAEQVDEAVRLFRERYDAVGKFENSVYPGIPELLKRLKKAGCLVTIATSKPEKFALQIADHFALTPYFDCIAGATMDESHNRKPLIIEDVLRSTGYLDKREQAVMIGDRKYDILGAKEKGIRSIGAAYGYGSREELEEAGADRIAASVEELGELLLGPEVKNEEQ